MTDFRDRSCSMTATEAVQFNGGITGARGHIGDNLGLRRIISLLNGTQPDRPDSLVFGRPLHNPELTRSKSAYVGGTCARTN